MEPLVMRDVDIRAALVRKLSSAAGAGGVVRHELGVLNGNRRVDVVRIGERLEGWEIKSDVDTLTRLPGQAQVFSQILDRATLVASAKHLDKAIDILPPWWGVMSAVRGQRGGITLASVRRPSSNPELDPMALAQLLWRDEAMSALSKYGFNRGLSGKSRWYVWERMAEKVDTEDLRGIVRNALVSRGALWSQS